MQKKGRVSYYNNKKFPNNSELQLLNNTGYIIYYKYYSLFIYYKLFFY